MRTSVVFALVIAGLLLLTSQASSEQEQMANCPLATKWSIATWEGPDATPSDTAFQTCGHGTITAAYSLDRETQGWYRYIADRPEVTTLDALNRSQGILALGSPTAPTTPTPEISQPILFTGSGDKDTGDFHISASQFTVSWAVESDSPDSVILGIFIYPAGETVSYVGAASFYSVGSDSTVVRAGPGDFWLSILAANCDWRIEVKE